MSKIIRAAVSASILTFVLGCSSSIEDLKSGSPQSTVPYTQTDGVVSATLTGEGGTIVADAASPVADSSILIPSGALAIDTATVELKLGEANDLTNNLATSLGFSAATIGDGTSPLYVGNPNKTITANQPLMISIPLPITAESVKLTAPGQLALLYLVYTASGYKAGIKPLATANLRGIFVEAEVAGLGFYRVIYLAAAVEAKEVVVAYTPALKTQAGIN